ncbi:FkbM family methyltransferase [Beggiatoa leptomitoformis]|uniref:FkbM family methyltransferase n=1 Tax=Beggiatoa leptomitoformis TaxID=288004 RepID=A0A2N9YEL3_9GAMM|nr:FkbM family methyltransferase [Beggiatoa leptomitoformis]ALG68708.1 FkbM family methyltransferase [Beggiatoa leptomitoformis]AUI68937.1 FkbM family methyltransferase [Beggiatoa leptomitoformis]
MFYFFNRLLITFVEKTNFSKWLFRFFTRILPAPIATVRGVPIQIVIPLNHVGVYDQFKQWESREPETLDWIDQFTADCVFFDVGSSFGTESLYAALKANAPKKIVSFDVDLDASFLLAYNLALNKITRVDQYFLGLSAQTEFIRVSSPTNFACVANRPKYDRIHVNAPAMALDEFISTTQLIPDYVKIDVDGAELAVLSGMRQVLQNPQLKSVLIEVSGETEEPVSDTFIKAGFKKTFVAESSLSGIKTLNLIFTRQ